MSNQNSYLREVRESQKVFSALVHAMEKNHKAVVDAIEGRQREEEKKVETLVKEIEQEIQTLKKETPEPDPQVPGNSEQGDDTEQVTVVSVLTFFYPYNHNGNCVPLVKTWFISCRPLFPQ